MPYAFNDDKTKVDLANFIYPVGSIYMSTNNVNPATLFGGTWERIQGQFLLASSSNYALGTTGGEATHALTAAEMPSHNHSYAKPNANTGSTVLTVNQIPSHSHTYNHPEKNMTIWAQAGSDGEVIKALSDASKNTGSTGGGQGHTHTIPTASTNTGSKGSGTAHNNMPPYLVVNVWKRTA